MEADMAAAWQSPGNDAGIRSGLPYAMNQSVLVMHEASLPLAVINQLARKTVHVVSGSQQEAALLGIKAAVPDVVVSPTRKQSEFDLMESVAERRIDAALVSSAEYDVGNNYYPELQNALPVGDEQPIAWLFGPKVEPDFIAKANAFITRMQSSGKLDRLKDRYFGHTARLTPAHSVRFIESIRHCCRDTAPCSNRLRQRAALTGACWPRLPTRNRNGIPWRRAPRECAG